MSFLSNISIASSTSTSMLTSPAFRSVDAFDAARRFAAIDLASGAAQVQSMVAGASNVFFV